MEIKKPSILFLSSLNPLVGPGQISLNMYDQWRKNGYDCDMLTLKSVDGYPDILHVYPKQEKNILLRIKRGINRRLRNLFFDYGGYYPYYFFYKKEENPPIPITDVLKQIRRKYDLVIVYFWQGMLSFRTVKAIYDKLDQPVLFFISADYSVMSGGCHFTGDCIRYQTGCGCCPATYSHNKNDFTHQNVLYRKSFYDKVKPVIFSNTYMKTFFYDKSFLLRCVEKVVITPVMNTEKFVPLNKRILREKYKITSNKHFIIGFGSQSLNDSRKGIKYLIEALQIFYNTLTRKEQEQVLIVTIGNSFEQIKSLIPFEAVGLGMIPFSQLSEFYSLLDVFVSASVNDAGPSMVGQSISCGTPVVGFEMGAFLDLVKGQDVGLCVELLDVKGLANSINHYYEMSEEERSEVSLKCRRYALKYTNEKRIKQMMDIYNKKRLLNNMGKRLS